MTKIERERVAQGIKICKYIIQKKCTMKKASEKFKLSSTTARTRVELVKEHDIELYKKAKQVQSEVVAKLHIESCKQGNITREKKAEERHRLLTSLNVEKEKQEEDGINKRIRILRKNLKPGDIVTVFRKDRDVELESNKKLKNVEVKANVLGIYNHVVLLNFNGIKESFTYDEIKRVIKY